MINDFSILTRRQLVVTREENGFVCDEPAAPGSPIVGRGPTRMAALGDYFWRHSAKLGFNIELPGNDPEAKAFKEMR